MVISFAEDIAAVQSIRAIPTILDIVCRTTRMRFAAVARVTDDRWVACSVRDEIAFGLVPGGELPVGTTICNQIRQTGEAVIIDHVAADASFAGHPTPAIYGFQSYISVPIRLPGGAFFGTLCAIDPEPRRLDTPDTVAMFEMFAEVIGFQLGAIERVNTSESALLNERAAAALREQFIAVLGHDLRSPLAAIDAGLTLLRRTALEERAQSIVGMMQGSVARMGRLISDVMDFARGRLGSSMTLDHVTTEDLEPLLRHLVAESQAAAPGRAFETGFSMREAVTCDPARLGQLVSNLLGNAVTHGAPDAPVRLTARAADGWLELSVCNAGEPIPPAMLADIFEPFTRGTHRPSLQGLGLGLFISREIAHAHGGRLSVASTPAETCFTLRMPTRAPAG